MGVFKINIFICLFTLLFVACSDPERIDKLDLKIKQQNMLIKKMTDDVLFQNGLINKIQDDLSRIDSLSFKINYNVENGTYSEHNQIDQITGHIDNLKEYLNSSERKINSLDIENKGFVKLIRKYKLDLERKEKK